jgi:predicted Rossmann fold nucleotide-binding protein DprA/Smf involved in DNA uptake
MTPAEPVSLTPADARYPARLRERLGANAPSHLFTLGNLHLLALPKTALFCSARCPGDAILRAYDQAAKWRNEGRCIISGFHSPVEKECLRILLRGQQPIIICPARSVPRRVPAAWQKPLTAGRLLIFSCFNESERRVTAELAARRNEFVAALADEVWFTHMTPGGNMERLSRRIDSWSIRRSGVPKSLFEKSTATTGNRPVWPSL